MSVIPALKTLRLEDSEFEARVGYTHSQPFRASCLSRLFVLSSPSRGRCASGERAGGLVAGRSLLGNRLSTSL